MIALRDYQTGCLAAVAEGVRRGVTRPLVSLPTGAGKTVIFAHLIKSIKGRSLIAVHRDELMNQAEDKLLTVWPDAQIGIVKAERNDLHAQVIIASVQTLSHENRLSQLRDMHFELLVTDEAHHAVAPTYRRIYDALLKDGDGGQLHLGVTATPNRADEVGLGKVYQEVIYHKSLLDMIRAGWLCDLRCVQVKTDISLDGVHERRGGLVERDLASVINTANRNELIVESYRKYASGRLALCFTVDVKHAHDLAKAFLDEGVEAIALSGKTPKEQRQRTLRQFHNREIGVITNCQLLTEGFDEPAIDCIILARPTRSPALYTQMIGRGTRTFPDKTDCLVIDVSDMAGRHEIVQLPDLVGLEGQTDLDGKKTLTQLVDQEREAPGAPDLHGRGVAASEVDLFEASKLVWVTVAGRYILNLSDRSRIEVMPSKELGKHVIVYHTRDKESQYLSPRPVNLDWALGIAESKARSVDNLVLVRKDAAWRKRPATEKQKAILDERDMLYRDGTTRGEAADIISMLSAGKRSRGPL